jgi:hypothetical protein
MFDFLMRKVKCELSLKCRKFLFKPKDVGVCDGKFAMQGEVAGKGKKFSFRERKVEEEEKRLPKEIITRTDEEHREI